LTYPRGAQFNNPRHEGTENFEVTFASPIYNECSSCSSCDFQYQNQNLAIENRHCSVADKSDTVCDPCASLAGTAYDLASPQVCNTLGLGTSQYCTPGTYLVFSVLTKSGDYMVDVNLNGVGLADSPFVASILPNEPYAEFTTIEATDVPLTMATAGVEHSFVLASYDRWLNPKDSAESSVTFLLEIFDATNHSIREIQSLPLGGGRFRMEYLLTVAGSYSAEATIMDSGVQVRGSPFRFGVYPNIFNAPTSTASNSGFSLATAGVVTTFQILTRDEYFNEKTSGAGEEWAVALAHDQFNINIAADVLDLENGRFQVSYVLTRSAEYT